MNLLRLISLLVFTIGAFSYGAITWVWLRERGRLSWRARHTEPTRASQRINTPVGLLFLVCFLWFLVNLLVELSPLNPGLPHQKLRIASFIFSFLFPPLIMHCGYAEAVCGSELTLSRRWLYPVAAVWVVSQSISIMFLGLVFDLITLPWQIPNLIVISLGSLFIVASVYSVALGFQEREEVKNPEAARSRRWLTWMFIIMAVLFVFLVLAQYEIFAFGETLSLLLRSMPLFFLFISSYFQNRWEFFDLFVKRGLALLVTVILLTAYFELTWPWLSGFDLQYARAWVYALALLPLALALPWLYRKLGQWLDNAWLGRRYTPVAAVKRFLSGLQSVTDEQELLLQAEEGIAEVFQAPTRIELAGEVPRPFDCETALQVPIRSLKDRTGRIRLGRRRNDVPFFSEDVTLLTSLAEVFAYMLENIRLQQHRQDQERRAKELTLDASRSKLKALRAQINPHFLFNALNAIAGLIHKDPVRADQTVEQLAEVFRYTLRRSENEWVLLEEEMSFVRAYLEVEQARFGDRLQFQLRVEEAVRNLRIPTMMLQTLVENAVKHGVAAVRGQGIVTIEGMREGDQLRIVVTDNGPGLRKDTESEEMGPRRKGVGYGLRNIRERLQGYFADQASLQISRDEEDRKTCVAIRMPAITSIPHPLPGPARESAQGGSLTS